MEIDLGEIRITNECRIEKGRFKHDPSKEALLTTLIVDAKDLGMCYSDDLFAVAEPFDMRIDFSSLNYSPLLPRIDSSQLNKSYLVEIEFKPLVSLRLTQDIYTFLCRCIDLNVLYTDYKEEKF